MITLGAWAESNWALAGGFVLVGLLVAGALWLARGDDDSPP